jgi:Rieske 2Fe-2S family protein
LDAFQEFYHAAVLHARQAPPTFSVPAQAAGFEAPYYGIDGPHRVVTTSGIRASELPADMLKPTETLTRSGLFGPWDAPDLGLDGLPSGINPGRAQPWGLDSFQIWPNFVILIWATGWYLAYHYWPTSYNTHVFEGNLYFVPAKNARQRLAHEMAAVTSRSTRFRTTRSRQHSSCSSRAPSPDFLSTTRRSCAATSTRSRPNGFTTTDANTQR